jgi:hypothetical protein
MGMSMTPNEAPGVSEKRERLDDPTVRRWFDNLARGSQITADNYLRCLFNYARRMKTTPAAVAKYSPAKAYESLLDFVTGEEKRGIAGSAIHTYVKAARSWLSFNGVRVDQKIKVRGAEQAPTLRNEEVPTQEGLRRILLAANSRQRVAVALVAFSGIRLEVVGNYHGTDGLTIRDLPDLVLGKEKISFSSLPARVIVRPELSKTSRPYFSWIGTEGAGYIGAYLEERIQRGERLTPQSAIFSTRPAAAKTRFIKSSRVSMFMRQAIDRAGFDFRPYNLRCYFDTQALLAESKGKLAHDYRVFWMGHVGSIENRYTTNKGRLPKELVTDMADAYRRTEVFLSTVPTADEKERDEAFVRTEILKAVGYTAAEAEKILADPKADVFAALREKLTMGSEPPKQRIVPVDEAQRLLPLGWTVVTSATPGLLVIAPP